MKTLINCSGKEYDGEFLRVFIFILAEKKLWEKVSSYRAVCFKVGEEELREDYLKFGFFKNQINKRLDCDFTPKAIKMFKIII